MPRFAGRSLRQGATVGAVNGAAVILVAGGSGRLGTLIVRGLLARGLRVRVLTRDRKRSAHLEDTRVEIVEGDVRDRDSLDAATMGVDIVVSAIHGFGEIGNVSPASVDRDGNRNLVEAAVAANAAVVLLSIVGASAEHPIELFRMKHAAEEHLLASGAPWTIVRATAFAEFWLDLLDQTAGASGRPVVFGRGDNPINFVSVSDVAALVERAVVDPSARGGIFEIGGPQNMSFNVLAAELQRASGRTAPPRHVPRTILRVLSGVLGPLQPNRARQMRAAIAMDTIDLTFAPPDLHRMFPEVPVTSLADILTRRQAIAVER
jgi:NADH dehydrogenase